MSKTPLIYVGRCLPTNKVYVGRTLQGKRRINSHIRDLSKGRHSNSYLQHAWDKYGTENFVWYAVENLDYRFGLEDVAEREQWWIDFMRASDPRYGFNLCNAVELTAETRSALSRCQIEKWRDPEIRRKRLTGLKKLHKDQEWKSERAKAMAARWGNPEWRSKMLKVLEGNTANLQRRMQIEPGFKEHRMRGIQPGKATGRA